MKLRVMFALAALVGCAGELEDAPRDAAPEATADAAPDASPPEDVAEEPVAPDAEAGDAGPEASLPDAPAPDAVPDAPADVTADRSVDRPDVPPDVAPPTGMVQYPNDRAHSPLTPDLAARLRAVATRGAGLRGDVLSKVGASNTVNTNYLGCFAGSNVDLAGRDRLRATVDWFRAGDAGGTDPYRRVSLAATVGWSAWAAVAGNPSPLAREYDAARPRYATIMFGTNDIQARDLLSLIHI